ncbi:MAG: DNA-3-methyladenine glycosylase [candidate division Zixibacteria bacterium RBG_16_53_22]|nr:MAG: DNA-3-methyladenine glycosylase [candidate division Zixibacteria bacterium RBG_16_53_22]
MAISRCPWPADNHLMIDYHDTEWGVPVHDDRKWFEFIVLDMFQAGLSWSIIMNKRENFRKAFDNFEPAKIARYNQPRVAKLLNDPRIIRNKLKIAATIANAEAFLAVQKEFGSFDNYVWRFVDGKPRQNRWRTLKQLPAKTGQSDKMSEDLKSRGFSFVGSTICYAFMQAAGMVNDHLVTCFRHEEVKRLAK